MIWSSWREAYKCVIAIEPQEENVININIFSLHFGIILYL